MSPSAEPRTPAHVVIIGAGITGLAAALEITQRAPDVAVTILERGDRVGGKIHAEQVGGQLIDVGAESILASSKPAAALLTALGRQPVHPEPIPAGIYSHGQLTAVPQRTFFGVPSVDTDLSGVLDEAEQAEAATDKPAISWSPGADTNVREAIAAEYGTAVVDRIVEPLMGGIYAGRTEELSLRATMRALASGLDEGRSLRESIGAMMPPVPQGATPAKRPPALLSVAGTLASLIADLREHLESNGVQLRLGCAAQSIEAIGDQWQITVGEQQSASEQLMADSIVFACPAAAAALLLAPVADAAAGPLGLIESADMVIVTMAFDADQCPPLEGSGFLVPSVEGLRIKASTFSSNKWAWLTQSAPETVLLRASLGRAGESVPESDEQVVELALRDIAQVIGATLPSPLDTHVQRWSGGIPQYTLGHTERIATARAALPTSVALAGASYDGVGIASCLSSAVEGAQHVLDALDLSPIANTL